MTNTIYYYRNNKIVCTISICNDNMKLESLASVLRWLNRNEVLFLTRHLFLIETNNLLYRCSNEILHPQETLNLKTDGC